MNSYYIMYLAAIRGKSVSSIGKYLHDSSNVNTQKCIARTYINNYSSIPKDKIENLAFELKVSPEWFYFAPVMFSAADFFDLWNDYLIRKKVPLMEKGQKGYEFVIGEKDILPSWFDSYFSMKSKFLNKQITKSQWTDWSLLSLKDPPEDFLYEGSSGESIRRYMRLNRIDLPEIAEKMLRIKDPEYTVNKKNKFLRDLKSEIETNRVSKKTNLLFSEATGVLPDICFSQFSLDSIESIYNFFVVCDMTLAPIYYLKARKDEEEYRKRLVINEPTFIAFDKKEDDDLSSV